MNWQLPSIMLQREGTHKRRQIGRRLRQNSRTSTKHLGGGGGNRTRVRGRTGQNVYKRSPRFKFNRRPEADTLPAA